VASPGERPSVYEWADSHEVVGNCHKVAAQRFVTRRLSIDNIVEEMETFLTRLRQRRPQLQVVLTVSPYRYAKWGYHTSTLSKSVLHLAAERLTQQVEGVHYFPAYEIVMDELRDYRFYDDDMLHPSAAATRYVGQRFAAWAFSDRLREYAADRRNDFRRPFVIVCYIPTARRHAVFVRISRSCNGSSNENGKRSIAPVISRSTFNRTTSNTIHP